MTFPSTSAAPIRWKGDGRPTAHIDDVEHETSFSNSPSPSGITFGPATEISPEEPGEILPVQFTLKLDAPRNGGQEIQTVAGVPRRKGTPTASDDSKEKQDSVLSSRRPTRQGSPSKLQLPAESEPPASFAGPGNGGAKPIDDDELVLQPKQETLQSTDDEDGPPQPAFDPDDAAPAAPDSLQLRAAPQFIQQDPAPGRETPPVRDPARAVLPPVEGTPKKKRRCNNPNDRDCCSDEKNCSDQLARLIVQDKLSRFDKSHLDITARWEPGEKENEHERNQERKKQQMTLAGKRQYQDRDGHVLGEGKLVDLALGQAIIETDSGEHLELSLRKLSDDDLCFIAAWYRLPTECTLGNEQYEQRQFLATTMTWKASAVCHKPLYFEDVQLERYGHTRGPFVQPVVSGAHFFVNLALVPYKMGINPPNECQYPLGYYRPGSCAPWMHQPFPLSARGAASAVGFYTAGNFLIP